MNDKPMQSGELYGQVASDLIGREAVGAKRG